MNTSDTTFGSDLDLDAFLISLNQTIQWCSRPGRGTDPETGLRTKELEPWFWIDGQQTTVTEADRLHAKRWRLEHDYKIGRKYWMWNKERKELVERVVANRASLLNPSALLAAASLSGGRIVAHWPDFSLSHGNTKNLTGGFFTASDVPPWDTWIAFFHEEGGYLLSWVPPEFVEPVSQAVTQSVDGALGWIEDLQQEEPVHKALKQKGLI